MTDPLWAPWRLEYVSSANEQEGCIFCRASATPGEDSLIVHRGESAFVLLNRFPYSSGHLMVAPFRHIGDIARLSSEEAGEIHELTVRALEVLSAVLQPDGFNLGWNLGRMAGAGVVDHVHEHVVPRWQGDTNFMPVLADVRVIPEHLQATQARLATAWSK
ncbi:MAG: HIT domain-containing protein [Gaiellaceae bacterium]|jgi:ATP adenylyltransferase